MATKKGNDIFGCINRRIVSKSHKVLVPLYSAMVRPHLKYCVQFWIPHIKKDADKLEHVQRRVTRMIRELKTKPYEEKLKEFACLALRKED